LALDDIHAQARYGRQCAARPSRDDKEHAKGVTASVMELVNTIRSGGAKGGLVRIYTCIHWWWLWWWWRWWWWCGSGGGGGGKGGLVRASLSLCITCRLLVIYDAFFRLSFLYFVVILFTRFFSSLSRQVT
jgi:hypothetical protein